MADERTTKQTRLLGCARCLCTDVQAAAWVEVNSGQVVNDEPPCDSTYCPQCSYDGRECSDVRLVPVRRLRPMKTEPDSGARP